MLRGDRITCCNLDARKAKCENHVPWSREREMIKGNEIKIIRFIRFISFMAIICMLEVSYKCTSLSYRLKTIFNKLTKFKILNNKMSQVTVIYNNISNSIYLKLIFTITNFNFMLSSLNWVKYVAIINNGTYFRW